ncbi:hypothetical protein EN828_28545 [Mesorhizobium sp. M2D.F.Ca.ET.185.01.1.1]|uniref:hypothetical protein n=1 Tax=unclassified Mesorhizobium TaxID=325217 RepID=UPI000FCB9C33|nr:MULTISPECIES: hypothetical protein [unclassified Mesorhizobium]TGP55131.1 hypothetical protein EN873_06900 [bacterium M00.F.Ca.ET.230.01.1.1]TGP73876.1 hypothetical protein EN870_28195 [bacterium M00.F.Ca.ET.227.01.1.1]TGP85753.1 hypothetical protein EN864_25700 [bacterium M00.F.Ca.ET.221.01.1.1]TGP90980.1 hypothetical protein EN865_23145 [bacterium M00.F.Ca.ET.222.01.1.1]TGT68783.1 hypothetical protein EN802_26180 [bacterium M00.F.Ca.ET.159.01.1.1]TGT80632.1 hypothetical protein EN800_255
MSKTSIPAPQGIFGFTGSVLLAITSELPQSMGAFFRDCVPKAEVFQLNLALARGIRANRIGLVV